MHVQFEFPKRDTFLVESDEASIWGSERATRGERHLYIMSTKTSSGPSAQTVVSDNALEAVVDAHRRCLSVEMRWATMIIAATSPRRVGMTVDTETLWSQTAPLPPSSVLSACFSIMPLHNAVSTTRPGDGSAPNAATHSLFYQFSGFAGCGNAKVLHGFHWESFLTVLHTICFHDVEHTDDTTPSRFALQAYADRATTQQRGINNVTMWPEEVLWKLLNSLVSCLAVFHNCGLHFNGHLSTNDVVCFSAPSALVLSVEDTITSLNMDPEATWSAAERKALIKTVASNIALPQAFVTSKTPAASAFFVVTRLPTSQCPADGMTVDQAQEPTSPSDQLRCQHRDLASVGYMLQSIIALRGTQQPVSPELRFLVEKLVACAEENLEPSLTHLSAVGLCQLQALRLRSALWLSRLEADEYNIHLMRLQFAATSPKGVHGSPGANKTGSDTREAELERREKLVSEREEKLAVLMELYELTTSTLDGLPDGRSDAFGALRRKLETLPSTFQQTQLSVDELNKSAATADASAPLDVSPVNYATPREQSALETSLFDRDHGGDGGQPHHSDSHSSHARKSLGFTRLDASDHGLTRLAKAGATEALSFPVGGVLRNGRRDSGSVYESEATLNSPSLAEARRKVNQSTASQDTAVTVELTAEVVESDDGTGYSGVEEPSALHTPPRQRLSPAKGMYTTDQLSARGSGVPQESWSRGLGVQGVPRAAISPTVDTHTPIRPTLPSLGKDDLSSQSKYTSIYAGAGGTSAVGHHHRASSATSSNASRHLHFDAHGSNTGGKALRGASAHSASASGRRDYPAGTPSSVSARQRSHSSTGGGDRRSPRAKTDESWIRHQYDTLEELRRSFSVHSSATRPSVREGSAESYAREPGATAPPQLRVTSNGDPVMAPASYAGASSTTGNTALAGASADRADARTGPSYGVATVPAFPDGRTSPSPRSAPWRTPVSSTGSRTRGRPDTAPTTAGKGARLGNNAGAPTPTVRLDSPGGPHSHTGSARRPVDGTMDLLQRLRATL